MTLIQTQQMMTDKTQHSDESPTYARYKGVDTIMAIEEPYSKRGVDVLKYNKVNSCGNYPLLALLFDAKKLIGDKRDAHIEYACMMYSTQIVARIIKKYKIII